MEDTVGRLDLIIRIANQQRYILMRLEETVEQIITSTYTPLEDTKQKDLSRFEDLSNELLQGLDSHIAELRRLRWSTQSTRHIPSSIDSHGRDSPGLTDPHMGPRSIEEAVALRDPAALGRLLEEDSTVSEPYSWVRELQEIGFSLGEIADLVMEDANDSPWIFFDPMEPLSAASVVSTKSHLPECVHQFKDSSSTQVSHPALEPSEDTTRVVEELCGLGGIIPVSKDRSQWTGMVFFAENNAGGRICYSSCYGDLHLVTHRLLNVLDSLCNALTHMQSRELCCSSFTIIRSRQQQIGRNATNHPVVDLCRIEFSLVVQLRLELKEFSSSGTLQSNAAKAVLQIISPLSNAGWVSEEDPDSDSAKIGLLQVSALAVQVLCVGLLSYCQAHLGPLQPFFLDTQIGRLILDGIPDFNYPTTRIEAKLVPLACMGDMLRSPVLAFSIQDPSSAPRSRVDLPLHYLGATAADLLDTWGPGQLIFRSGSKREVYAIQIGGGVIRRSNSEPDRFHWSQRANLEEISQSRIDLESRILIGSSTQGLVEVNDKCLFDKDQFWLSSYQFLAPLGPEAASWHCDEIAIGLQGGQYVVAQANMTWHKRKGVTLKEHRLSQPVETLVPFLEELWAVQVSCCTGIARRVALRDMIADFLPVYASVCLISQEDKDRWQRLITSYSLEPSFRASSVTFRDWLSNLPQDLHHHVIRLIQNIFRMIQHTGLDQEENNMLIAWPDERALFRCFRVECKAESAWAGVLGDSQDCASFIYYTPKCFETGTIKCSGNGPKHSWRNAIRLLETEVIAHDSCQANIASLDPKKSYFFQKMDDRIFFKVERSDAAAFASLVSLNSVPLKIQRRIMVKFMSDRGRQLAKLREKSHAAETIAERVAILAPRPSLNLIGPSSPGRSVGGLKLQNVTS